MLDSTTITLALGLVGTIASGAGVWAVTLYRLRQCERAIEDLRTHDQAAIERAEAERRLAAVEREQIRTRITRLEIPGVPRVMPESPTPIVGIPWDQG